LDLNQYSRVDKARLFEAATHQNPKIRSLDRKKIKQRDYLVQTLDDLLKMSKKFKIRPNYQFTEFIPRLILKKSPNRFYNIRDILNKVIELKARVKIEKFVFE